ncbi:MAG: glutamate synthase subunit beta [Candidatus Spyradenecus sp.]
MHRYRPVDERRRDWAEVELPLSAEESRCHGQACMTCGVPFCHGMGCPLSNPIPETNTAVASGNDALAYALLSQTDLFAEFTSHICPALCEGSCTRGMEGEEPVSIRALERHIIDTAWANGWVKPVLPERRIGKRVAVVGSGPAGLAAAELLNRAGVEVTVYERSATPGGLLRYGIPDFKLAKTLVARRIALMEAEGIRFVTGTEVGKEVSVEWIAKRHDAVLWAIGTAIPRNLALPGRDLEGIHFALDFLIGQNRALAGELPAAPISAKGRDVLVIGGGDTGSDCVGTARRQGAHSITQVEILPMPPAERSASTPWPRWPWQLRTSSSHEEGCERLWNIESLAFEGSGGRVSGVKIRQVAWTCSPTGKPLSFTPVEGSERTLKADLVLLAMGFTGVPEHLLAQLPRNANRPLLAPADPARATFACGDCVSGPTLVVRALADGRRAAQEVLAALA